MDRTEHIVTLGRSTPLHNMVMSLKSMIDQVSVAESVHVIDKHMPVMPHLTNLTPQGLMRSNCVATWFGYASENYASTYMSLNIIRHMIIFKTLRQHIIFLYNIWFYFFSSNIFMSIKFLDMLCNFFLRCRIGILARFYAEIAKRRQHELGWYVFE